MQRRRADNAQSRIDATSLSTLIQIAVGGLGVTLAPEIAVEAGLPKCSKLVARPFSRHAASPVVALGAPRRNPHRPAFALVHEFSAEPERRWGGILVPLHRHSATTAV